VVFYLFSQIRMMSQKTRIMEVCYFLFSTKIASGIYAIVSFMKLASGFAAGC
jgi:hypothetical protein